MDFVRVIKHSNDLEKFIDIPEGLKNRKVEIIILPYTDQEDIEQGKKKELEGSSIKVQK